MRSDEDLARGVQQGDADDLQALVARHHGRLFGFLFRMAGGDRQLAEDLTQETFVRMLRGMAQYRYPRPFKPWLYAIGVNLARDTFKGAAWRRTEALTEAMPLPETGRLAPERVLLRREAARAVETAVGALPAHQRAAVLLRYREGMSLAEVAAVLDVPVGTVKSRLSLALRALRAALEEEEV
ncbi:MAG: RNA polymerase sigma factor [Anaerolineales bacterium]|nr:RNA polymerase sigma factor [Anaerolineales bacterium]